MATYKAEFLSHYYKGRLRPRHAYAFGLIHHWARLASAWPGLANWLGSSVFTGRLFKWTAGIAPNRQVPQFAHETFQDWFRGEHVQEGGGGPPVILWPDTFNNFFHPNVGQAAVTVLEDAGFRVLVPQGHMCCGRPLYDYGMLETAKRWLLNILENLREEIRAGVPLVVLEPGCCAVFRDELCNLMPNDLDAQRLRSQTFLLSELIQKKTGKEYRAPLLHRDAVAHLHCHHRAIMGPDCEEALLRRMQLDSKILDSGCCGMAGAFGFEKGEHYEVSIRCGERVLLPAVRKLDPETLIITNGFSCHEQMAIATGVREEPCEPREREESVTHVDGDGDQNNGGSNGAQHHRRWLRGVQIGAGAALLVGALWWPSRDRHRGTRPFHGR